MSTTSAANTTLALHGGTPVRDKDTTPWPKWPQHTDAEREGLLRVLDSGSWWYGEEVAGFEREFAANQDAAYCVSCTSGTTAAEIAMQALGIRPGDEVIVPPYTFVATAMTVARIGAVPVFVDVDDTWCMNPNLIEEAITEKTKAIMPVHFGASLADMDRINAIAKQHGLYVIEDACHTWGGKWKGKGTGALGDCGVFSFQSSKNMTAAEGGAIVTDNKDLADRCRSITHCGRAEGSEWFEHPILGTNARLTEFQGVLLRAQLAKLNGQNDQRRAFAAFLDERVGTLEGLSPQPVLDGVSLRTYHIYGLGYDADAVGCPGAAYLEALQAEGLNVSGGYKIPLYRQPYMKDVPGRDYMNMNCPVTERLCANGVLWMHQSMLLGDEKDREDIATIFEKVHAHRHALGA